MPTLLNSIFADISTWRMRIADMRGRGLYAGYPDQYGCIFVHVPKTAGTSVSQALFSARSRHIPYSAYLKANPRKFENYFKFCFVRNPWDRLVSTFTFLKGGGMNAQDRAWAAVHLAQYENFEHFVEGWLSHENVNSWVHFYPQHSFVCDEKGKLMVDFVGRYETLARDFSVISERLDLVSPLNTLNASPRGDYRDYFSPKTKNLVQTIYARDIAIFGYEF